MPPNQSSQNFQRGHCPALIFIAPSFLYLIPQLPLLGTTVSLRKKDMADALILRCLCCGSRTMRTELPHSKVYQAWLITRFCLQCTLKYHVCRGGSCSLHINRQVEKVFKTEAQLRRHHLRWHAPPVQANFRTVSPLGLDLVQPQFVNHVTPRNSEELSQSSEVQGYPSQE